MKYGPLVLHLTWRVSVVLFVAGLALPVTGFAVVVHAIPGKIAAKAMPLARAARGATAPKCTATPSGATITIASPLSITPNAMNGTPIGDPASVTVSIDCSQAFLNTPNYYDDFTPLAGRLAARDTVNAPPGGQGIMFKTNVAGISVLLTAAPNQANSGPNGRNGGPGWHLGTISCDSGANPYCTPNPISATFTAQLVKTGPVAPSTVHSIQLLRFYESDFVPPNPDGTATTPYPNDSYSYGTLTLNAVTVSLGSCSVSGPSQGLVVTLPTISVSALNGTGMVAGTTPFQIQYSCSSGASLSITLNTATPGTASGVILPPISCAAGTPAANVGVRLLQGNQQAVDFGTAQALGASPNGTLTIPYYAQYYATGSSVGAGPVCATATFTMSYQ
ncbi:MAG: type 1 fimbrial protein [Rhodanobacter sp.]|nr:MAG: type 1 fimbrial protein [Rhodanobacter sp.]